MTDFAAKHAWWPDALLLKCGLISRTEATRRGVPHIKAGTPEQTELDHFQTWLLWRAKGALPPRPGNLSGWKPEREYWTTLAAYLKAHKPAPPAPPPAPPPADNPPSRWKNAPWTKKHVHVSYGMRNVDGVWTPAELVNRCVTYGARAIFAQLGDDNADPDWAEHARELYVAGKKAGLQVGGWGRADYVPWDTLKATIRSVMPLDGFLADIEGACQDDQLPEHLVAEFADEMPLGVIATGAIDQAFPGHSVQEVAARFGDFFDFCGQDYFKVNADPPFPMTPDMGENFVYWRGTEKAPHGFRHLPDAGNKWHVSVLMPNAEGCPPLADQKDRAMAWVHAGGVIGAWDGELLEKGQFELGTGDWDVFASIGS